MQGAHWCAFRFRPDVFGYPGDSWLVLALNGMNMFDIRFVICYAGNKVNLWNIHRVTADELDVSHFLNAISAGSFNSDDDIVGSRLGFWHAWRCT